MSAPLVRATGVAKVYSDGPIHTKVLDDVSLEVMPGELTLLMGPSGSGKTTLISILAGLMRPTDGTVELCETTITGRSEATIAAVRRHHLGFVFQSYNLFPALSAFDNVATVLRMHGLPEAEVRERARDALGRVGLSDRLHHRPAELSGGQKQRVAIARAIAGNPSLVIGDEVTAALDTHTGMGVMKLLEAHVKADTGVLLVTHDHRLEAFADRIIEMQDGRVVRDARRSKQEKAS